MLSKKKEKKIGYSLELTTGNLIEDLGKVGILRALSSWCCTVIDSFGVSQLQVNQAKLRLQAFPTLIVLTYRPHE